MTSTFADIFHPILMFSRHRVGLLTLKLVIKFEISFCINLISSVLRHLLFEKAEGSRKLFKVNQTLQSGTFRSYLSLLTCVQKQQRLENINLERILYKTAL